MTQFIGRYYHALEQKGRLSIPKNFRNTLGETAVVTRGLDGCLFLFPKDNWQSILEEAVNLTFTKKKARDWVRLIANNAVEVEFDRLGRVLIPEYLRDMAQLEKDAVVVGSINRIEIWNRETYHAYLSELEKNAENIAESLGEEAHQ